MLWVSQKYTTSRAGRGRGFDPPKPSRFLNCLPTMIQPLNGFAINPWLEPQALTMRCRLRPRSRTNWNFAVTLQFCIALLQNTHARDSPLELCGRSTYGYIKTISSPSNTLIKNGIFHCLYGMHMSEKWILGNNVSSCWRPRIIYCYSYRLPLEFS